MFKWTAEVVNIILEPQQRGLQNYRFKLSILEIFIDVVMGLVLSSPDAEMYPWGNFWCNLYNDLPTGISPQNIEKCPEGVSFFL